MAKRGRPPGVKNKPKVNLSELDELPLNIEGYAAIQQIEAKLNLQKEELENAFEKLKTAKKKFADWLLAEAKSLK